MGGKVCLPSGGVWEHMMFPETLYKILYKLERANRPCNHNSKITQAYFEELLCEYHVILPLLSEQPKQLSISDYTVTQLILTNTYSDQQQTDKQS